MLWTEVTVSFAATTALRNISGGLFGICSGLVLAQALLSIGTACSLLCAAVWPLKLLAEQHHRSNILLH